MTSEKRNAVHRLFETGAVAIGPPDKPYWYPNGRIGLIRVRGARMFALAEEAPAVAALAATAISSPALCLSLLNESTERRIAALDSYALYLSLSLRQITGQLDLSSIDAVAGSTANEWNLSLPLAKRLGKPHLLFSDDGAAVLSEPDGNGRAVRRLDGQRLLVVCELIAGGQRFSKVLQPQLETMGGDIRSVYCLIDRGNGGSDRIIAQGITCLPLFETNADFYRVALELSHINQAQYDAMMAYQLDPVRTMGDFLAAHPEFLTASLAGDDESVRKSAALCVEKGYYRLGH